MSLPVVLTHEAQSDFDAAADWYEEQSGLGAIFTTHVREALNQIGRKPELNRLIYRNVRRTKVRKHPTSFTTDYRRTESKSSLFSMAIVTRQYGRTEPDRRSLWARETGSFVL